MEFDLGIQGLGILAGMAVVAGLIAQVIPGGGTRWIGLIVGVAAFIGGLFVSEVMFAGATEEEVQPVIDGLAFDEAMLGTLVVGVVALIVTRFLARGARFGGPSTTRPGFR